MFFKAHKTNDKANKPQSQMQLDKSINSSMNTSAKNQSMDFGIRN